MSTPYDDILHLSNGLAVRCQVLKPLLPDIETALFWCKAMHLDYKQVSMLLRRLFNTSVLQALLAEAGEHSEALQDYIVEIVPSQVLEQTTAQGMKFVNAEPPVLLPELFEQATIEVAQSISEVVGKLAGTLNSIKGVYGEMAFRTMAKMNKQRAGVIGSYEAQILHKPKPKTLVIFDVSGSMTERTVKLIVDEVVALAYKANATLVIVSNYAFRWAPGVATSKAVLEAAEYGGTHYEMLYPVLEEDWDVVVTIADYDSSYSAKSVLASAPGHISQVFDISLVKVPTFLAECVGQRADKVTPLLIGAHDLT